MGLIYRQGIGYDVHKLVAGRDLVLAGVKIDFPLGLLGHSDADVLTHALMDAMLGAAALGDIGQHFPDTDPAYKGISSLILLKRVSEILADKSYRLVNADIVVMAQRPKLAPHIIEMRKKIAGVLQVDLDRISIKATTTERLGFVGREAGMAAMATVSISCPE